MGPAFEPQLGEPVPDGAEGTRRGAGQQLPVPLSHLIGREDDVAGAKDLFCRTRIVTVTGPGGVGKTRVAIAVASEVAARYRDGAWYIDVASVDDVSDLWASTAGVCGMEPDELRRGAGGVVARPKPQLLLLLDNCDRFALTCADLVLAVARACPGMALLLTSRQPVLVEGERLWPMTGLVADGPGHCRRRTPVASPAVRLFVDRARAQRPDFALDAQAARLVEELCRRLDGLPLAIELAAARVGVLSPGELLARSDDPLSLLVGGGPATPARHRSLAAMLGWSHERLSEAEATLFRRLAVFAGGFCLAAAEKVCSSPPLGPTGVLGVLGALVAKSLVVTHTAGGETRYRLHETTRAYATDRLAAAEEDERTRERHARWCRSFVKEAHAGVRGPAPDIWMARLAADHDNVEAALEWAVDAERSDWALEMAAAMVTFWRHRDLFGAGKEWLEKALALPDQPSPLRFEALLGLGYLIGESGDRPGAIVRLEDALTLAKEQSAGAEARVLSLLGYFRLFCDVPTTALLPLERSTEMALVAGDRRTLLASLSSAGWAAVFAGDARVAEVRFRQCLIAANGDEHCEGEAWPAVVGMGWAALTQGRFGEAEARLTEALGTAERADSTTAQSAAWCFLGQLARARGDYAEASALLRRALSCARETTNSFPVIVRLVLLGGVAHDQGDLAGAEAHLLEALAEPGAHELPFAHAQRLLALGSLRLSQGRVGEATALLEEGAAVAEAHGFGGITAAVLVEQARLRRLDDDPQDAAKTLIRAIQLDDRRGDGPALMDALESLGGVRAGQGRCRTACRLFAAAATARRVSGAVRPPVRESDYERDVARAQSGLSADEWDDAWTAGSLLSMARAAAAAVRSQGRRDAARAGWDAITPTEREVVALVAQGLTNREAAARLVVSTRTVETHVAHVLTKLDLASRRELARVASAKGFGT